MDEAPELPEDGPKKKSGLIGQVILAVLLGAVAFGTVYMLPQPEIPAPVECSNDGHGEDHDDEKHAEVGDAVIDPPELVDISFVALDPLLVSLGKNPATNHLKIGITLEAAAGKAGDINYAQPKLRDAFTAYLRAIEVAELEDPASIVKLRSQLLRRAEVVLGEDVVYGVLITEFIVR